MKQLYKPLTILMLFFFICSWSQDTISKKKKMPPSLFAHNSMQRVGPNAVVIKGGIKHPRILEFYLNGNAAIPSGDNVSNSTKFNPSLGVNYFIGSNVLLGLEGSFLSAKPKLDFDTFSTAFTSNPSINVNNNNNDFKSTSLFFNVGYSLKLKHAEKLRHQALNFILGNGVVFNSYPNQSITGSFNGKDYTILSNMPPDGYHKTNFAVKPKLEFVYMISDWLGFNVTAQYQINLGTKEYTNFYKDLSNVDFTKPQDIVNQQLFTAPKVIQSTQGLTSNFSIGAGLLVKIWLSKKGYEYYKNVSDRTIKTNGQDDGRPFPSRPVNTKLLDSLRTITIQNLPNPSEHINGGPNLIAEPAIDCICTETHGGTCDSDWGEICGCDGYQTDRTSHGSFFIPKDYLNSTPFLVYKASPKTIKSLANKEIIITSKLKLDSKIAKSIGVKEVSILPGVYSFTKENLVSLPITILITPTSALYHAINEKGLSGTKGPPPCSCNCCEKSPGVAWKCCTN